MTNQQLFDAVCRALGFPRGRELSAALGANNRAASNWRHGGFPPARVAEVLALAEQRGVQLPDDVRKALLGRVAPPQAA